MSRRSKKTQARVPQPASESEEDVEMSFSGRRGSRAQGSESDEEFNPQSQHIQATQFAQSQVTATQAQRAAAKLSTSQQQSKAQEIVRYVLCRDCKKTPIAAKDISDAVLKGQNTRAIKELIVQANQILQETFGYELVEMPRAEKPPNKKNLNMVQDKTSTGKYLLVNRLADRGDVVGVERDHPSVGLLLVILAYIFMQEGRCLPETTLWEYLERLGLERSKPHAVFAPHGKAEDALAEFVKQAYIDKRKGEEDQELRWGPRAQVEVDREKLIEWLAGIYGEEAGPYVAQFRKEEERRRQAQEGIAATQVA
eukprot:comp7176_c0_seq1/m.2895 comp7176_c0_seq1/g.2895  ORF comp7176_c0_seq1/g.2895 comp7176_c0_seq1/m.2895 type:complete len:311 (-) comp7176_c0_seq1:70-1002(-)